MLLTYKECVEKYGNPYQLEKRIADGRLYKLEPGIYSENAYESEREIIMKKYPSAVFTGEYAFYCHGLTDVIPEKYYLATPAKAAKISDERVIQIYTREDIFSIGIEEKELDGGVVRIYDLERMLIELLRNKNIMPYDLYKEILCRYRGIIDQLDIWRIQEYANIFPKSKMIRKALDEEVM